MNHLDEGLVLIIVFIVFFEFIVFIILRIFKTIYLAVDCVGCCCQMTIVERECQTLMVGKYYAEFRPMTI